MESFETYRPYLFAIAYRMLGSAMDAEDMVQETYLRYQATPKDSITSLKAFLTTIISHLCLDQLHLARNIREQYLGPWLPEPIITASSDALADVERRIDAYETISLAFLVLLEQLQPIERAVFLLREVFEYDYAEIAAFLGKSVESQWLIPALSEPACLNKCRRSMFDPYATYVLSRWEAGVHDGKQLFEEIRAKGFTGSVRTVGRFLQTLREKRRPLTDLAPPSPAEQWKRT